MGVYDGRLTETIANVLAALGAVRAMVVHAEDGLDELSTVSPTKVSQLAGGRVTTSTVSAEQLGLRPARMEDLIVDSAAASAGVIRGVLAGTPGAARDIVILNAAAGLVVADKAGDMASALPIAERSIDSGSAAGSLDKLVRISNS